jgi:hypothetical protein
MSGWNRTKKEFKMPKLRNNTGRVEQPNEYHKRVQEAMDRDSWVGRDEVGQSFPKGPAIVHDMFKDNPSPNIEIYKWEK